MIHTAQRLSIFVASLLMSGLVACGEANETTPSAPEDATPDSDAAEDTSPNVDDLLAACLASLQEIDGVAIAPEGELSVQVSLATTGDVAWIAYSGAAREGSNLAPWLVRLDCDHQPPLHTHQRMHDDPERNVGQPTLAGSDDLLMAAWQRADGANDIYLRRWRPDGTPLDASPWVLRSTVEGDEVSGRTWQPHLAVLPGGGFVLVATRVDERWGTFRPWMQRFDADGEPMGEGIALVGAPGSAPVGADADRHEAPKVLALQDGSLRIAWDARTDEKDNVVVMEARPQGDTWALSEPVAILAEREEAVLGPWLSEVTTAEGSRAWLAAGLLAPNESAWAVDVTEAAAPSSAISLVSGQSAFRTVIVSLDGAHFVAWQSRSADSPLRGSVRTAWLDPATNAALGGAPTEVDMDGQRTHVLYPLDAVPWQGGVLYAWTAGSTERSWVSRLRWEPAP